MKKFFSSFSYALRTRYEVFLPVFLYVFILLPNLGFIGLYDGNYYQECIFEASKSLLHPERLFCYGHPSIVFFAPYALAMRISGGSVVAFNLVTVFFGSLSVIAFASLAKSLLPAESQLRRMLLACVYATHPLILATTLNVSADTGFMLFAVVFLACLFERRYALASISGLFLVFSKEPGIVFLVASSILWAIAEFHKHGKKGIAEMWLLLFPVIGFVVYLLTGAYKITYPPDTNVYFKMHGMMNSPMIHSFLSFNPMDPRFHMFLGGIFVLNFAWIAATVLAAGLCVYLIRLSRGLKNFSVYFKPEVVIVGILFLIFIYALTRVSPANNFRYLGPVYALFLLLFGVAASFVTSARHVRTGILMLLLVLQIASIYQTIDPVSRYLFGTFPFGKKQLLILDRSTPPCCSFGIDEVLYNLEFMTRTRELQQRAYEWIKPKSNTIFVHDTRLPEADRIDLATSNLARKFEESIIPQYLRTDDNRFTLPDAPQEVFFIHYPNNFGLYSSKNLYEHYKESDRRIFDSNGYELAVFRLEHRK